MGRCGVACVYRVIEKYIHVHATFFQFSEIYNTYMFQVYVNDGFICSLLPAALKV